jgi:hypothetical protein
MDATASTTDELIHELIYGDFVSQEKAGIHLYIISKVPSLEPWRRNVNQAGYS